MAECCIQVTVVNGDFESYLSSEIIYVDEQFWGYEVVYGEATFYIQLVDAETGHWQVVFGETVIYEAFGLNAECPESVFGDWSVVTPSELFDSFSISPALCPPDVYCCVNVGIINDDVENILPTESVYIDGEFIGYQVGSGELSFVIQLTDPNAGSWVVASTFGGVGFNLIESLGSCPISTSDEWTELSPTSLFDSFYIFEVPCEIVVDEEPNTIPSAEQMYSEPCRYINLLKKQKAILAKEIAGMKSAEVLGLKSCEKKWEKIYEKYLIIKALECCPYDEYSLEDERCLIGHLTDNCNC